MQGHLPSVALRVWSRPSHCAGTASGQLAYAAHDLSQSRALHVLPRFALAGRHHTNVPRLRIQVVLLTDVDTVAQRASILHPLQWVPLKCWFDP